MGTENVQNVIDITEKFTDEVFREYIRKTIGIGIADPITTENVKKIERIWIKNMYIGSINGVEYIKSLKKFECIECVGIDSASFSKLPDSLEVLDCTKNELTALPELPNSLIELKCSTNKLSVLPKLPNSLKLLDCSINQFTVLPELPDSLELLVCDWNQFETLHGLPCSLKSLSIFGNPLLNIKNIHYIRFKDGSTALERYRDGKLDLKSDAYEVLNKIK